MLMVLWIWRVHWLLVELLLARGAAVDKREDQRFTALMVSASQGEAAVAAALLEGGAAPDLKNNDMATALMIASFSGHAAVCKALLDVVEDVQIKQAEEIFLEAQKGGQAKWAIAAVLAKATRDRMMNCLRMATGLYSQKVR